MVVWSNKPTVKNWRDYAQFSKASPSDGSEPSAGSSSSGLLRGKSRVMGMQGSAGLIAGRSGVAQVAVSRWWTTKGVFATKLRETEEELLRVVVKKWGHMLVHVFDRGDASGNWLQVLRKYRVRFVIRWGKNQVFLTTAGQEKKLWQSGQGKK